MMVSKMVLPELFSISLRVGLQWGSGVAPVWPQCGSRGSSGAPVWLQWGSSGAPVGPQCGSSGAPVWLQCGPSVAPVGPQCGSSGAPVGLQCGSSVAPVWLQCGPSVAPVGLLQCGSSVLLLGHCLPTLSENLFSMSDGCISPSVPPPLEQCLLYPGMVSCTLVPL